MSKPGLIYIWKQEMSKPCQYPFTEKWIYLNIIGNYPPFVVKQNVGRRYSVP